MKRVLMIGVSGQDGSLLAKLCQAQGIEHAGLNREGVITAEGVAGKSGKLTDPNFAHEVIRSFSPTHIYYLAAHHHSSQDIHSGQDPHHWKLSIDAQALGLVHVLEAMRLHQPDARLFYAASSHIFGAPVETPQNETTPMLADTVYGITKLMGMEACRYYQRVHGLFASVGILYNHESALRKEKFLSQKIIRGALEIKKGRAERLVLGDLSAQVDWGYAPDYVDAMARILALADSGTYVVATGEAHEVTEFVSEAFAYLDLDYRDWVVEDSSIIRKSNRRLVGDASKLRCATGWAPTVSFSEMVRRLIDQTRRLHPHLNE